MGAAVGRLAAAGGLGGVRASAQPPRRLHRRARARLPCGGRAVRAADSGSIWRMPALSAALEQAGA
eukprot:608128-Prymnesium_polylepis.1